MRLVLMLDRSRSMGKAFGNIVLPACAQLHRTLAPDACSVILFGDDAELVPSVPSAAFFSSPAMTNTQLQGSTNLAAAMRTAVQRAIDDNEKFEQLRADELLEQARQQLEVHRRRKEKRKNKKRKGKEKGGKKRKGKNR